MTIAPCVFVGVKYFDGKVTDSPYETGLLYDENKQFISENGIEIDIFNHKKTDGKVFMEFALNCSENVNVESAEFFIARPATNKGQIKIQAEKNKDGKYASVFDLDKYGHYVLKAKSKISGKDLLIQKSFYIN